MIYLNHRSASICTKMCYNKYVLYIIYALYVFQRAIVVVKAVAREPEQTPAMRAKRKDGLRTKNRDVSVS